MTMMMTQAQMAYHVVTSETGGR